MRRKGMITGMSHSCDIDNSVSFPFENLIRNLSCFSCGEGTKTFTRESNWSQYMLSWIKIILQFTAFSVMSKLDEVEPTTEISMLKFTNPIISHNQDIWRHKFRRNPFQIWSSTTQALAMYRLFLSSKNPVGSKQMVLNLLFPLCRLLSTSWAFQETPFTIHAASTE